MQRPVNIGALIETVFFLGGAYYYTMILTRNPIILQALIVVYNTATSRFSGLRSRNSDSADEVSVFEYSTVHAALLPHTLGFKISGFGFWI